MRNALIVPALALVLSSAGAVPGAAAEGAGFESRVEKAFERVVDLSWRDARLADVLALVGKTADVTVVLDNLRSAYNVGSGTRRSPSRPSG